MRATIRWDPPPASATLILRVMPAPEGSATLLPEPLEILAEAVDKAAPAARAAAARVSQTYRRRAAALDRGPSDERTR